MLNYLLRRILLALPTLVVISFFAFGLGKCASGDPVVNIYGEENFKSLDPQQQAIPYRAHCVELGLDGPVFYFELTTAAFPDTLYRIFPLNRRERLRKLIGQTGNWPAVQQCDAAICRTVRAVEALPASFQQSPWLRNELVPLLIADKISLLEASVARMNRLTQLPDSTRHNPADSLQASRISAVIADLEASVKTLGTNTFPEKLRAPAFHWYGANNQYHRWLTGFATGRLGLTRRKVPVWDELQSGILCTLSINGLAILLAYLFAIPLGVEMARRKDRFLDRWGKRTLFFLFAMPVFWLGGLLIMLATNTEWIKAILPSIYFDIQDAWQPGRTSFGEWWSANSPKCVLPILILSIHALAILVLQMRSGVLSTLKEDYIRTARAKGVPEEEIYWSHALRNALFPIITIFGSVLPAIFTGSLVVETLFGFPGIGTKTFQAYAGQDLPLLSVIMMISAALTILGSLLADLLYAWADPRVRLAKENG
jgi:peptide/nickel transport system permease protein